MKIKIKFLENAHNPNIPDYEKNNIFIFLLKQRYEIDVVDDNPDILFYPLSHNGHINYSNCVKVFQTEEPGFWNKNNFFEYYPMGDRFFISASDADIILSGFNYPDNKHNVRFPSYLLYYYQMYIDGRIPNFEYFFNNRKVEDESLFNRKFCVFIHSHKSDNLFRTKFLNKLNEYKPVDVWNDPETYPGYGRGNSYAKTEYVKQNYKFCFSMENTNTSNDICFYPNMKGENYNGVGYMTEKIIEPFCSNSVPLYWGNSKANEDFNNNMFIDWNDYGDDNKMIEKIIKIDNSKEKYMNMLNGVVFKKQQIDNMFKNFLDLIDIKLRERGKIW
jgi:hypothetical protein